MNTKRVNNEFHRLDVKLPIDVYTQISEIAVNSFDARVHHISGKPEITPTLIYLLEMGIQSFLNGSELIKKYDTDKLTDNIPITEKWVKELIKDELIPIQSKLDELSEMVYRLTNTDNNTDNELIGVENIAVAMTERILEDITDSNTDNDTDKISHSESSNLSLKEDHVMEIRKDTINPYVNNLNTAIEVESKEVEEEDKPIDLDIEVMTPNSINNGNNELQSEDKEDIKPKRRGRKVKLNDNGLTESKQKVMDNIVKIPSGNKYSYAELASFLGVSRTVLDSFENWKVYFKQEPKKRGYDYVKL